MHNKRLLLINFTMDVNSPVLGWQARVAYALAEQCDKVVVFTDSIGSYKPHPNMEVRTFRRMPRVGFLLAMQDVYHAIKAYNLNVCFVHMAHHWAYKLWPVLAANNVPIMLWYAHGHAPASLRVADWCITRAVTSTPSGYPLSSQKLRVIGQGIDTDLFMPPIFANDRPNIISFGRIAPRKRLDFLIDAFALARKTVGMEHCRFDLYGPCMNDDDIAYKQRLNAQIESLGLRGFVSIHDPVTMRDVPPLHKACFLHLSASQTDSMDKTLLESLACGVPILTSNVAFKEMCTARPEFIYSHSDNVATVAQKIVALYAHRDRYTTDDLRAMVVGVHDQKNYAAKLLGVMDDMLSAVGE